MLKSKNPKQTKEDRRMTSFSDIPRDPNTKTQNGQQQNGSDLMDSLIVGKYKEPRNLHVPVERKVSKEIGQNKPRVEKEMTGRSMQRKGAIADEYAHKMLASEAVVTETLRVSGLGFQ